MEDKDKYYYASDKVFKDFGGWDAVSAIGGFDYISTAFLFGMKIKYPGKDLPSDSLYQLVEEPIISPEDYDLIIEGGWPELNSQLLRRIRPDVFPPGREGDIRIEESQRKIMENFVKDVNRWKEKGIEPMFGAMMVSPFCKLSEIRSLWEFTKDLYRYPDKVWATLNILAHWQIEGVKKMVEMTGIKRVFLGDVRSAASLLSLKFFEKFAFPILKEIINSLAEEGIVTILHFDDNWTKNLPYFLQFPKGKCVLMLDGRTDIFKAKEILGNHMCIMGDVPASLLTLGTPEDVENYVKRLIDRVGRNGGFILCSGCEVPLDTKDENFRSMIETAKTYGIY